MSKDMDLERRLKYVELSRERDASLIIPYLENTNNEDKGLIIINRYGRVIEYNQKAKYILGYAPEEVLGVYYFKAFKGDDRLDTINQIIKDVYKISEKRFIREVAIDHKIKEVPIELYMEGEVLEKDKNFCIAFSFVNKTWAERVVSRMRPDTYLISLPSKVDQQYYKNILSKKFIEFIGRDSKLIIFNFKKVDFISAETLKKIIRLETKFPDKHFVYCGITKPVRKPQDIQIVLEDQAEEEVIEFFNRLMKDRNHNLFEAYDLFSNLLRIDKKRIYERLKDVPYFSKK